MHLSRRQLLLVGGGVGAAAVVGGLATERGRLHPRRGPVPHDRPGAVVQGTMWSHARGRQVRWQIAYPPGHRPGSALPLALVLHGRGGDSTQAFGSHHLDRFLAAAVRTGTPPYALVAMDGGDHTYWHRRANGDDPQAMLLDELLPLLARRGLRTQRFGVTGWSMGGYGALLLAATVPDRMSAVSVDAAALWRRASDTRPGAFDGPEDFARHDVLGHIERLRSVPLRVGCGRSDPFIGTNRALVKALPHAEHTFVAGGHDLSCWDDLRPGDVRFLGAHV